jgi:hypothetical protein
MGPSFFNCLKCFFVILFKHSKNVINKYELVFYCFDGAGALRRL